MTVGGMRRILLGVVGAGILLAPVTASAGPSPSPSLGRVLADPLASGFVEVTPGQGPVEGPITAREIAGSGVNPNQDEASLVQDGFVGAFGRTWVDNVNKHELQELVIAFSGGAGAARWMGASKKTDSENQYFIHSVAVAGVPSYYGVHLANPTQSEYVDIIGFVKGNDYFLVAAASTSDDLDATTAVQAKGQYDFAPLNTIPPSQWPEHPIGTLARFSSLAVAYGPYGLIAVGLVMLVILAILLVRRRRRAGVAALGEVQMSPDGTYWWDGLAWRDASQEVPPAALRSGDGYYWWDGRMWRLMPETPAAVPEAPVVAHDAPAAPATS